jgi:hypothetical protein
LNRTLPSPRLPAVALAGDPEERAERYRRALVDAGMSADQAAQVASDSLAVDKALEELRCPRCDAPLRRSLDGRQAGFTAREGSWVNYRCTLSACRFAVDRVEPDD